MKKRLLRNPWVFLCVLAFLFVPVSIFAQSTSGDLTGLVLDPSGASIPSAKVVAANEADGVRADSITNAEGVYRFANLPVGLYTVSVAAPGFSPASVEHIQVQLSNTITQNVTVKVGGASATVEVTESAAAIDTTTAQLQTTFEAKQIEDVPSTAKGTGIWNLGLISAGVASQGGVGQGTGPSVAGMRPEDNTFLLDGVSNVNHYSTGPLVYTSNEAIEEVSMLQNQFSPEFGGASGGVFNAVVKSGGNALHGDVYEYMQNRNLNAVDALDWVQGLTTLPRYDNNRLGATIGGPILKNKLFYFGNMEYQPIGQVGVPGAPLLAPTSAGYSALGGISGVSATNLAVFQKYVPAAPSNDGGTVSVLGASIPVGNIGFTSPTFTNNYNALVSLDYNMSEKDQFRGRWVYNKQETIDAAPNLPVFDVFFPNNNYLYSLSEFHNFSPTLQNEFRASFSRNVNAESVPPITFPGLTVFPNITIDELNTLNIGPDGPSGSIQNLFQLQDNASKVLGRHTIKFGYHFTDVILTNYFIQRVRGDYEYATLQQYLQDLAPDTFGERSAGATSYPAGFLQNEGFVNDDYRIRKNLTLNLGLRYEYVTIPVASRYQVFSTPANVPGGITFNEPKPNANEWSPRLGFAYSPGSSQIWSIRGGFSRAFDPTYANLTSNSAPPYFQQTNDVSAITPNFLKNGGLSGALVSLPASPADALAVATSYTYGGKRPYGLTWTLGVQRAFKKDYTFEARYVGTKGVHLWNQTRSNIDPLVSASNYIPTFFSLPAAATFAGLTTTLGDVKSFIVPGGTSAHKANSLASLGSVGNIVGYAPQGYSSYNGLALQLNKRYSNHFAYVLAYTWSHLLDDATATNFSTYLSPRRAQDFQNLRAEWASSALDRRHRLTFAPVYDFKPFQNGNWFMKNLIGNWNISGVYTYETPEFATVQSGLDSNLNGDSAGDRTVINPAGNATIGSGVTGYNSLGAAVKTGDPSIVAYVANNSSARYVVAGSGARANSGRNTFPLKPTDNIDAALQKRFNFTERLRFDIGAQFFNILNHAQYTGGFISDVASNGYIGSRNDLIPSSSEFGRFDQFYSSNSRQVQLTARFTF